MARPLREELFFAASLTRQKQAVLTDILVLLKILSVLPPLDPNADTDGFFMCALISCLLFDELAFIIL